MDGSVVQYEFSMRLDDNRRREDGLNDWAACKWKIGAIES